MKMRNRKKSDHATDLLSASIDGELPPDREKAVRRHLDACPDCRKEYEILTSMDHLLRAVPDVSPSADFSRSFWKKVEAMESRKSRGAIWITEFFGGWRPSLAAASAVVILVAGAIFFYPSGPENNDAAMPVIADNMTFYGEYEIVQNLELFENWEAITSLEEI